jgi:hypothetical protein
MHLELYEDGKKGHPIVANMMNSYRCSLKRKNVKQSFTDGWTYGWTYG